MWFSPPPPQCTGVHGIVPEFSQYFTPEVRYHTAPERERRERAAAVAHAEQVLKHAEAALAGAQRKQDRAQQDADAAELSVAFAEKALQDAHKDLDAAVAAMDSEV